MIRKPQVMSFRVTTEILDLIKLRTDVLGMSYSDYISRLVQKDTDSLSKEQMELHNEIQRLREKLYIEDPLKTIV
jgi:cell division protein FtsB